MSAVVLKTAVYFVLVLAAVKPLGSFIKRAMNREKTLLDPVLLPLERVICRLGGVDPTKEQTWRQWGTAMLLFNGVSLVVLYVMERAQQWLPLNPDKMAAVPPALAWNTAVSFTTNTNWQAYSGETTMSHFTQMAGLAVHNFTSAATGIAIAIALVRGIARTDSKTIGNFWSDLLRSTLWVLLPLSLVASIVLMSQGVIQNFDATREVKTVEGAVQKITGGPVASQEAIKELGTNGGGFTNANSAHPFENPTPFTNLLEMWLIFAIGGALTYTLGLMTGKTRHGWAVFWTMALLFAAGALLAGWAETRGNPIHHGLGVAAAQGNMEGKEVRFGAVDSALFATVTTDASCGAINAWHDSFTPIGGLVPLVNIELGEVIFGGVGAGLYGMLLFVILAVFIAGLMVGRTPEYLGKRIEAHEVKLAMLSVLILTFCILVGSAAGAATKDGLAGLNNAGPHGLSEILYAYSSATGNNGSAFAGLNANSNFYNTTLGFAMFFGRFWMIVPLLGIAGSLASKKRVAESAGTFPVDGPLYVFLLGSVVLIVGALTFFPVLALGPLVEDLLMQAGKVF